MYETSITHRESADPGNAREPSYDGVGAVEKEEDGEVFQRGCQRDYSSGAGVR